MSVAAFQAARNHQNKGPTTRRGAPLVELYSPASVQVTPESWASPVWHPKLKENILCMESKTLYQKPRCTHQQLCFRLPLFSYTCCTVASAGQCPCARLPSPNYNQKSGITNLSRCARTHREGSQARVLVKVSTLPPRTLPHHSHSPPLIQFPSKSTRASTNPTSQINRHHSPPPQLPPGIYPFMTGDVEKADDRKPGACSAMKFRFSKELYVCFWCGIFVENSCSRSVQYVECIIGRHQHITGRRC